MARIKISPYEKNKQTYEYEVTQDGAVIRVSKESDSYQKLSPTESDPVSQPHPVKGREKKKNEKEQYVLCILFLLLALRLKYYYNSRVYHLYF